MRNFIITIALGLGLHLGTTDPAPEPYDGGSGGGAGSIICCHYDEIGSPHCAWPGPDGCESGDKAIVCRYGVAGVGGDEVACVPGG